MFGTGAFQQVLEGSLQHGQFVGRRKGDGFHGNAAVTGEIHNMDGLFLAGFCKRVFQQGAAVTHDGAVVLTGVEMAQGCVVEIFEAVDAYGGGPAGRQGPFAVRGGPGTGQEHMGQGYFAGPFRNLPEHPVHLPLQCGFVGGLLFPAEFRGGQGFAVGQGGEVDRAGCVLQHNGRGVRRHRTHNVQLPGGKQGAAEVQPVRVVVVPGNEDHRQLQVHHQPAQGFVQQVHRFRGGDGPVVDIPGHQQGIHLAVPGQGDDLIQGGPLVLQKMETMEDPSQMPVRSM